MPMRRAKFIIHVVDTPPAPTVRAHTATYTRRQIVLTKWQSEAQRAFSMNLQVNQVCRSCRKKSAYFVFRVRQKRWEQEGQGPEGVGAHYDEI
jgi:hypothetical protein